MMCSWRFLPACEAEDHLVDAALLVAPQVLADLVGRADRAAEPADALLDDLGAEPVLVLAPRRPPLRGRSRARRGAAWNSSHTLVRAGWWRPNT